MEVRDDEGGAEQACVEWPAWAEAGRADKPTRKRPRAAAAASGFALREASFCDELWLEAFGPVLLHNAFDYFARSPFYERAESNNEDVRARGGGDPLVAMRGVEYRVHGTRHSNLFVVTKQYRCSQTAVRKLAIFYILENQVFPAPALRDVLAGRISKCCTHLSRALAELAQRYCSPVLPERGSSRGGGAQSAASPAPAPGRSIRAERSAEQDVSQILRAMVAQFVPTSLEAQPNLAPPVRSAGLVAASAAAARAQAKGSAVTGVAAAAAAAAATALLPAASPLVANETPALLSSPVLVAPSITPKTSPPSNTD